MTPHEGTILTTMTRRHSAGPPRRRRAGRRALARIGLLAWAMAASAGTAGCDGLAASRTPDAPSSTIVPQDGTAPAEPVTVADGDARHASGTPAARLPTDLSLPSLMAYPPPAPIEASGSGRQAPVVGAQGDLAPALPAPTHPTAPSANASCAGILQRQGDRLVLDGQPVTFFGINAQYLLDPEFPEEKVHFFLRELAAREVNTVRIWFFDDADPDRLERLLDVGRMRGLKFVVTLADHVFKDVDWFGGDEDEERYRPHVVRTVERFKHRPEILMWELINEPSCGEGNYSAECAERIKGWLRSRAREVAAIDACHLVSTGMIGAGNYDEERDEFRRIHREDAIQIVSAHRRIDEQRDVTVAIAAELDRPLFYGEIYGKAYDEGCQALEGSDSPRRRAGRVQDDLEDALEDGVDGYLLWTLAAGRIATRDGERYYCGVNDYELDDPLWKTLADDPDLPPPVPWGMP